MVETKTTAIETKVYDTAFEPTCLETVIKKYIGAGLTYGWKANVDKAYDPGHWNRGILTQPNESREDLSPKLQDHPEILQIWESVQRLIGKRALLRCYVNAYTYGTEGYIHRDESWHYKEANANREKTTETIIIFLNKNWHGDYAGETVIFNEEGDIEFAVIPKFNRMLIFDSTKLHVGRSVSRMCHELRTVLVFKTDRIKETPPAAKPEDSITEALESEDPRFIFLREHTESSAHSGKTFYQHLKNVYQFLKQNHEREEVCFAGLYHSVYGTEFYKYDSDAMTRDKVREMIGEYAEELAYIFCNTQNRRESFLNNTIGLTTQQQIDLCKIEYANLIDQNENGQYNQQLIELIQKIAELIFKTFQAPQLPQNPES
jgi:2OG-Fe(II) oxygenase superfamily